MRSTRTHRHDCGRHGGYRPRAVRPCTTGGTTTTARMQMMDLPDYLDSFRLGYERALEDLQGQLATAHAGVHADGLRADDGPPQRPARPRCARSPWPATGTTTTSTSTTADDTTTTHRPRPSRSRLWAGDDCRCDCCIVDADYVVYARCFERRVVPIQIENDTRKVREDVTLEVSDVRSAGGRALPWKVTVRPASPLTLAPCSTTEIDLLVDIRCGDDSDDDRRRKPRRRGRRRRQKATAAARRSEAAATRGATSSSPTSTTAKSGTSPIRVGGCLIRPIVVAIAVLPRDCDAYHAGCSCSCC